MATPDSAPEFDQTPPKAGQAQYRLQLVDANWTEWRDISVPIKESYVLSIQLSEWVTKQQAEDFWKQIKVN